MNSDDKIKTEKIGDVTISPTNTQRQGENIESLEFHDGSTNKNDQMKVY